MKISVITVSYNSAATIRDTLESVCCQRHALVEHLIIDGGSSDQTARIVREYGHVTKWLSEPDHGLYDAMNKGIRMASGDVIGILNSDDFYAHPGVLSAVARKMEETQAGTLYADLKYVHPRALHQTVRHWRSGAFSPGHFRFGWMPPHPTFFVRREVYEQFGGYDIGFRSAADYELMLRLLYKHRVSTCYLPEVIVHMRTGGLSNASLRHRWHANREDRRAWIKNGLRPAPFTLLLKPLRKIPQYWRLGE